MNNKQATIEGLKRFGMTEVLGASRKYKVFRWSNTLFCVGKSGALRKGRIVSQTISITNTMTHEAIREIGRWHVPKGKEFTTEKWRELYKDIVDRLMSKS